MIILSCSKVYLALLVRSYDMKSYIISVWFCKTPGAKAVMLLGGYAVRQAL